MTAVAARFLFTTFNFVLRVNIHPANPAGSSGHGIIESNERGDNLNRENSRGIVFIGEIFVFTRNLSKNKSHALEAHIFLESNVVHSNFH